jgi:hypothetical protein
MSVLRPFVITDKRSNAINALIPYFYKKDTLRFFKEDYGQYRHVGASNNDMWIPIVNESEKEAIADVLGESERIDLRNAIASDETTLGAGLFPVGNLQFGYNGYEYIFGNLTGEDENLQTPYLVEGRVIALKKKNDTTWYKIEPAPKAYLFRPIIEGAVTLAPTEIESLAIDAKNLESVTSNNFHDIIPKTTVPVSKTLEAPPEKSAETTEGGGPPGGPVVQPSQEPPPPSEPVVPPSEETPPVWDQISKQQDETLPSPGSIIPMAPRVARAKWNKVDPNPFPMLQNDWLFNTASYGSTEVLFWGVPLRARIIRSLDWLLSQKFPLLRTKFPTILSANGQRGMVVYFQYDENNNLAFLAPFGGERVRVTPEMKDALASRIVVRQKGKSMRAEIDQVYVTAVREAGGRLYPMWLAMIEKQ